MVMSLVTTLGTGGNLLEQGPAQARRLEMPHPVLTNHDLPKLRHVTQRAFPAATIHTTFHRSEGDEGLQKALDRVCRQASEKIAEGYAILVLSDRTADAEHVPIPSLLATAAVHHHLVREATRTALGLVVEPGEPPDVHHFALLIAHAPHPTHPSLPLATF